MRISSIIICQITEITTLKLTYLLVKCEKCRVLATSAAASELTEDDANGTEEEIKWFIIRGFVFNESDN